MPRPVAVFDSEVFTNWTLFLFRNVDTRETFAFEHPLDLRALKKVVREHRLITFNGIGYDIPILMLALKGATSGDLKKASNRIITQNLKPWNFEKEFNVKLNPTGLDHVDLMEVAPMTGSLKLYGGRMYSRYIQELPIPHDKLVTDEDKAILRQYCANDLETTTDLYRALKTQLELRESMTFKYGIDLRSKSDAQIAEAVIKSECEKILGERIFKPGDLQGNKYTYAIPDWMQFRYFDILNDIRQAAFIVNDKGSVLMPKQIESKQLTMGAATFSMGIGGLHSTEERQVARADDDYVVMDFDVTSYYPQIILNQGLYPPHIGQAFLRVYRSIVEQRIAAKRAGNKAVAESLKIAVNGSFGKLGSKWSVLYAPGLMVQVTITGQLALLMLIESLSEVLDCTVVSANTDGVTVRCHKSSVDEALAAVKEWETRTGFATERADYRGLYSRDVNNYVAILTNGDVKTKGVYGKGLPLHKNPVASVCARAVVEYLKNGTPIRQTVESSEDVREFISIRSVTGGALYRGELIGKVIRWYYTNEVSDWDDINIRAKLELSDNEQLEGYAPDGKSRLSRRIAELRAPKGKDSFYYKTNGYTVATTEGAKPLMELPLFVPDDLDREWYVAKAESMLKDISEAL